MLLRSWLVKSSLEEENLVNATAAANKNETTKKTCSSPLYLSSVCTTRPPWDGDSYEDYQVDSKAEELVAKWRGGDREEQDQQVGGSTAYSTSAAHNLDQHVKLKEASCF